MENKDSKIINYYLVLEKRPGDYNIIDINNLDICNIFVKNNLLDIDNFTKQFTEEEIKDSVDRSNMVGNAYLHGDLKVISDIKHNLPVLTKKVYESIINSIKESNFDQNLKNRLYGKYKKNIEKSLSDELIIKNMENRFKENLNNDNLLPVLEYINLLDYVKGRELYFTIYSSIVERNRINIKKLERPE